MRICASALLSAMAFFSLGQVDSNPYNPANWQELPATGSHYDTTTSWWKVGNVVYTGSETFTHVPVPTGTQVSGWGSNTSGESHSGKMVSSANVTLRKKWIGVGSAPLKIWVVKFASVSGTMTPDGSFQYENELANNGSVTTYDSTSKTVTASGSILSQETITGGNLEVTFSLAAASTAAASSSDNFATSNCGCSVTIKGAFITGPPTYRSENGLKVINEPKDRRTDVVTVKSFNNVQWGSRCYIWLGRSLFGSWQNPFHDWLVVDTAYTDDLLHEYEWVPLEKIYSLSESNANVTTAYNYNVTLKIKDILNPEMPGGPIQEEHHVFVHAPIFKVQIQATVRDPNFSEIDSASIDPAGTMNNSMTANYNYAEAWSNIFGFLANTGQGIGAITGQPWVEAIGSILGITEQLIQAQAVTDNPNFHDCYVDVDHIFLDAFPTPNPESGWEMVTARRLVKYDNIFSRAEKYGANGYESYAFDTTKIIKEKKTSGSFNLIGTSLSGGWSSGGQSGNGS